MGTLPRIVTKIIVVTVTFLSGNIAIDVFADKTPLLASKEHVYFPTSLSRTLLKQQIAFKHPVLQHVQNGCFCLTLKDQYFYTKYVKLGGSPDFVLMRSLCRRFSQIPVSCLQE